MWTIGREWGDWDCIARAKYDIYDCLVASVNRSTFNGSGNCAYDYILNTTVIYPVNV